MSKIVCDVCGTSYPDTAEQCPICGSAKPEEAGEVKSYTYVKGGRFSARNVNKRLKEKQMSYVNNQTMPEEEEAEEEPAGSNRGLIIAIVLLFLAILAVAAYLYINYWMDPVNPDRLPGSTSTTGPVSTDGTQAPGQTDATDVPGQSDSTDPSQGIPQDTTVPDGTQDIPCQDVVLDTHEITLSNAGDGHLINYTLTPADTTDGVRFSSSDSSVATVDKNGKITAVAPGSAVITVTCGTASSSITVVCDIETVPPTEPPTEPPTVPAEEFKLRTTDMTMKIDEVWDLYRGNIPNTSIEWWSDNEAVATVDHGGVVKCVGAGTTKVYAKYNGQVYECIVRGKAE